MFMPLATLHYADEHYKRAYVMCTSRLKSKEHVLYPSFLSYCKKCIGVAKGKVTFERRLPMTQIMTDHANVVLSWQRDWSLNYLTLECLWLGIPVVHNCPEMKHFGFYYHENDLAGAVAHIKRLNEEPFDRKAYKAQSRRVMELYGPNKPELLAFLRDRIKSLVKNTAGPDSASKRVQASVVDREPANRQSHAVQVQFKSSKDLKRREHTTVMAFM